MRDGVGDFIEKPLIKPRIIVTLHNALRQHQLSQIVLCKEQKRQQYQGIICASPHMQTVYYL